MMSDILPINNLELAESVRSKLNATIAATNSHSAQLLALHKPTNGNYRIHEGVFQVYETGPVAGWRSMHLVDGVMQFGPLIPDEDN